MQLIKTKTKKFKFIYNIRYFFEYYYKNDTISCLNFSKQNYLFYK